jgi:hypothetical protein
MAACTWKGVTRSGGGEVGAMDMAPAHLPAWVEARYRQGWRRLVVTAVGGGRTWHAERA